MEALLSHIYVLSEFFGGGIYDFFTEIFAKFVEWYVVAALQFKIFAVQFAWDVAENIIANIGISAQVSAAWGALDSTLLSYLTFFKLPEALNVVIQAVVTRFTLDLIL